MNEPLGVHHPEEEMEKESDRDSKNYGWQPGRGEEKQCSEGVSQRRKEGKGVPSTGICMCKGLEDRESSLCLQS